MKITQFLKFHLFLFRCSALIRESLANIDSASTIEEAEYPLSVLERLADMGHPHAQAALGFIYSMDSKPWYNISKAIHNWQEAAEVDKGESYYDLGVLFYTGRPGLIPDPVTGMFYMKKAAMLGQKDAIAFFKNRSRNA